MALDSVEQERIDLIKAWWALYRQWVLLTILLVVAVVGGWYGWKYWQQRQSLMASEVYARYMDAVADPNKPDIAKAKAELDVLAKDYASTAYTWMAALNLAKRQFETGDKAGATQNLQLVYEKAKGVYRALATLDLMSLYMEDKKFNEALALSDWKYPSSFNALFEDRKGDIYVAQKKMTEARAAYQKALSESAENGGLKELLQLKLSSLTQ